VRSRANTNPQLRHKTETRFTGSLFRNNIISITNEARVDRIPDGLAVQARNAVGHFYMRWAISRHGANRRINAPCQNVWALCMLLFVEAMTTLKFRGCASTLLIGEKERS